MQTNIRWTVVIFALLLCASSYAQPGGLDRDAVRLPDRAAEALETRASAELSREDRDTDGPTAQQINTWFTDAVRLQREGRLDSAVPLYKRVLKAKPDSASSWNNLGKIYEEQGDDASADAAYKRAIGNAGTKAAFYQKQYADFLSKRQRTTQAIATYENLALAQSHSGSAHHRVSTYYLSDYPERAEKLVSYLWRMVDTGQTTRAGETALAALEKGPASRAIDSELLSIAVLPLSNNSSPVRSLRPILSRISRLTDQRSIGQGAEQIITLFRSPDADASWWAERGSLMQEKERGLWPRDAYRAVARTMGYRAEQQENYQVAESYYMKAATLDNVDELDAMAFQALCKMYVRQNRTAKIEELLENSDYSERLFTEKNIAYRKGNLDKIYQYHVTLGYIYAALAGEDSKSKWWGDSSTVNSAVFQLEHAIKIGKELDERQPVSEQKQRVHLDPGVVELLANHYADTKNLPDAIQLRLESATRLDKAGYTNPSQRIIKPVDATKLNEVQLRDYTELQLKSRINSG